MSDDDSGVDSGNESTDPGQLAHRAIDPAELVSVSQQQQASLPVQAPTSTQEMEHQSVFIQIDPPEMEFLGNEGPNFNTSFQSSQGEVANLSNTNNSLPVDGPVMLCPDANNLTWPTTFKFNLNELTANESTSGENGEANDPLHTSSTSDSSVRVLGFKLRIDEDTMTNLQSFYQSNNTQHNFCPKMMKSRKHRITHYENIIAEKQLRTAANANDYKAVCQILEEYADTGILDINAADTRRRTALHFASVHGNFAIAYILLDHGANPNKQDVIGNTPLHLAVCSSKLDIVILLLKNGANVNMSDYTGRTPIQLARSKLSLLSKNCKTLPTVNLKLESTKISIMLGHYFDNLNSGEKKAEIDVFKERLEARETNEEIEKDVNDLLKCLDVWSIS